MLRYLLQRGLWAIVTILAVMTFVFVALRATGDPTVAYLPLDHTEEQREAMAKRLGTDKPLLVQYGLYMRRAVVGDLGRSHRWNEDAIDLVISRLPATLKLASVAFLLSLVVSIPLGVLAGTRPNSWADLLVRGFATAGQAVPNFILAILLVMLFAVQLRWLPVSGDDSWKHYVLPAMSLAWFSIASQTRITRSAMLDVLRQDYVRTARSKGLHPARVLTRHALRGALVPILTMIGLGWVHFVGGTIIVELIFAWPGIGRLLIDAAFARDFAVVQTATIALSVFFILVNLVTDLSYQVVDPRLRVR